MECGIYLSTDDKVYTDLDLKSEKRSKKLNLLGITPGITEYKLKDLQLIFDLSDSVRLFNPIAKIDAYTFAFEEVFRHVKPVDLAKLIIHNRGESLTWSMDVPLTTSEFKYAYYFDNSEVRMTVDSDLHKLLFYTWYRLYDIEDKKREWNKAYRIINKSNTLNKSRSHLGGRISDNTFDLCAGTLNRLYSSNIDRYDRFHLDIHNDYVEVTLLELAEWSEGRVLPYKRKYRELEIEMLVDKDLGVDAVEEYFDSLHIHDIVSMLRV